MKTMTRLLVFLLLGANVLLAQTATEKSILKLPLINRINNDYQVHLKKQTGEDHESVLALLKGTKKPTPAEASKYALAKLPDSLTGFPKWTFDVTAHDRELEKRLVKDKTGLPRLKADGYDEHPSEELLLPFNPSMREINRLNESYAEKVLDAAGYKRCDSLLKLEAEDGEEPAKVWQIESNVFFLIHGGSGAWRMRDYSFVVRLDDEFAEVAIFNSLPSAEIARIVRGVIQQIPEACNNMAVLMENRLTNLYSYDEEEVEILFKMALMKKCKSAAENFQHFKSIHAKPDAKGKED